MAGMALQTIYNHYLTAYAPNGTSRFDTHKKSELRGVYNSIVKINKESPLSIIDTGEATQRFAVGIKEDARELRNTIASLGGLDETTILNKKAAFTTNESIVDAYYVGSGDEEEVPSFEMQVLDLAAPQVNAGRYVSQNERSLDPDTYSFDVNINGLNYEFQFNVNEEDTNRTIQERLNRLINNAGIGIHSEITEDTEGRSALKTYSDASGIAPDKDVLFTISDNHTSKRSGTVSFLGLGEITSPARNARFLINGEEHTTMSNNFTVGKTYEITLKGLTKEDDAVTIGVKPDVESFTENIDKLVSGYNTFLKAATEYTGSQPKAMKLLSEMTRITAYYGGGLDSIGLSMQEDGSLKINADLLKQSALSEQSAELFAPLKNFTGALIRKTNSISLDPMEYVNKTIVAYKNPGHSFASPYITSAYSGMMFNGYC